MAFRHEGVAAMLTHALTHAIGYSVYAVTVAGATFVWARRMEPPLLVGGLLAVALSIAVVWLHRRIDAIERHIRRKTKEKGTAKRLKASAWVTRVR
jgi:uncharacterized membrane protein